MTQVNTFHCDYKDCEELRAISPHSSGGWTQWNLITYEPGMTPLNAQTSRVYDFCRKHDPRGPRGHKE